MASRPGDEATLGFAELPPRTTIKNYAESTESDTEDEDPLGHAELPPRTTQDTSVAESELSKNEQSSIIGSSPDVPIAIPDSPKTHVVTLSYGHISTQHKPSIPESEAAGDHEVQEPDQHQDAKPGKQQTVSKSKQEKRPFSEEQDGPGPHKRARGPGRPAKTPGPAQNNAAITAEPSLINKKGQQVNNESDRKRCSEPFCAGGEGGWFSKSFLKDHCDLELAKVIRCSRNLQGKWLCPYCIYQGKGSGEALKPRQELRYGYDILDEGDLKHALGAVAYYLKPYIDNLPDRPVPPHELIARLAVLPRLMGPFKDVASVKEKLVGLPHQLRLCHWIEATFALVLGDFMFGTKSSFQDDSQTSATLVDAGFTPEMAAMITQDNRLKEARRLRGSFIARKEQLAQELIEALRNAIGFLMGKPDMVSFETREKLWQIAQKAVEVNVMVSARRGTYELIYPKMDEVFDNDKFEATENIFEGQHLFNGLPVLLCMKPGLRYQLPGRPWVVRLKAKVLMYPIASFIVAERAQGK